MKIMRFEASSEQEAIKKVKEALGNSAVILNVKKIKPRGIFKFFKKAKVEVMAAYEEKIIDKGTNIKENDTSTKNNRSTRNNKSTKNNKSAKNRKSDNNNNNNNNNNAVPDSNNAVKDFRLEEQEIKIRDLESKLMNSEELLNKFASQLYNNTIPDNNSNVKIENHDKNNKNNKNKIAEKGVYSNTVVQLFYDSLTKNGVVPEIAEKLLDGVDNFDQNNNSNINMIVKIVYNRIIDILGTPQPIVLQNKNDKCPGKIVVCMGPTGVGKTTTIAKLCSHFILSKQLKVGLITADTYRISAVDQLKTYADILGINVSVVYNPDELTDIIKNTTSCNDIVFIDTAGRSHKNSKNVKELELILMNVPNSEKFLVLSATTKYEDLLNIIEVYSDLTDYKLIFTKIDETSTLGTIFNICYLTKKPLSYITDGQNVPDDIKLAQSELIARTLLGSSDV